VIACYVRATIARPRRVRGLREWEGAKDG
jgi:hypothetical protein